jgi:UDP-glucose 4-epimerase
VVILVTGYKGFIGSHLCRVLGGAVGLDLKDGLKGDVFNTRIANVDVVYHLAAQSSVMDSITDPELDAKTNILMALKVIQDYPNARIIYTGSGGASQEHIASPYGLSKRVAGEYLRLLHWDCVILNLPNVYGDGGSGVIERFAQDDPITIYGDGQQTRDFVHVQDIVDALIKAQDWPTGEYWCGAGESRRVIDIAERFNKRIEFRPDRSGELKHSEVLNITPNWKPAVSVDDYISGLALRVTA